MSGGNRTRKFDWDEAARLYVELGNYQAVGRELGVTGSAIRLALNEEARARQRAYHSNWQRETKRWIGICVDCGGPATRTNGYGSRHGRCKDCSDKAKTTSVRPDTLRCSCCGLWLPDDAYPRRQTARARRFRHGICTPCGRVAKSDWRAANADRSRAYDRERKRLQRQRRLRIKGAS